MTKRQTKGLAAHAKDVLLPLKKLEQIAGEMDARPHRFGIVASRFNDFLTKRLARSAVDGLKHFGALEQNITLVWVPGAFEIPLALDRLARQKTFSALLAIGAIIQGETPHATLIATEITHALAEIARAHDLPVIDGVLCAHTLEQAKARSVTGENSRGWYAARAAIEMANLMKKLPVSISYDRPASHPYILRTNEESSRSS